MKLTYIENIRLPTEKAHGFQIMKTSEALVRAGLEVELFVADRKNPISDDAFAYYQMTPSFPIRKLPVIDLMPIVGPLMRFAYAFERWTFLRAVKRLLEKSSVADAAYTRDPVIADAIRTASPKTPLFVELHDDRSSWPWQELSRSVTGWIVISQALKRVLVERRIASDRILVEPDAYDASAFADLPSRADARSALGIPDDMFLLVYTGKLFRWKGVDTIAPAFDSLPPNCQVAVIGGHPDDVARVKALAGPSVAVRFVGELLRNEAYRWLAAADAAILPTSSKFDIGMLYTSPLKLFEYLAAGLPIVASDVPSSREILDEHVAVFFKPDDAEDFARAVREVTARSVEDRAVMFHLAKERAMPYTWTRRGERIARFIQDRIQHI